MILAPPDSGTTALALVMAAAALMVVPDAVRMPLRVAAAGRPARRLTARWRALVAGTCTGATLLILLPDRWWVATSLAALAAIIVGRRPGGRSARQRHADRRAVAACADLLAACLDAGMAVAPALRATADVLRDNGSDSLSPPNGAGGPPTIHGTVGATVRRGRRPGTSRGFGDQRPLAVLESVAAMLSLGADAQTAWRAADSVEELAPLAAAARRSAAGGGRLAQAVRDHAMTLRADDAASELRAAGRAGVLMTAPLGICFLPAFLCLGLAPVVVGLLGQLDVF